MTGKDVEKKELLPSAGRNTDYYKHCDKQDGSTENGAIPCGHTVHVHCSTAGEGQHMEAVSAHHWWMESTDLS